MAVTTTSQERIDRLKALLVGESSSRRAGVALAAAAPDRPRNLLLAVMLHGANRLREGRELTDLERLLVDALETVVDTEEVKAWGLAYRETVTSAPPWKLIVPFTITSRPSVWGYSIADLARAMPKLAQEAWEAPNVSLLWWEDWAAGRVEEDEAFVEAMRETGFAVTGVARYPASTNNTAGAQDVPDVQAVQEPWRVRLEMESFYVERAVGDQGGGRDEIYFAASSGVGEGQGQTFVSEEFGAVKKGQTRQFSRDKKVFLDKPASGTVVAGIQVWEADQSNAAWYDKLQLALESAVYIIDEVLEKHPMSPLIPVPDSLSLAWEVAKIFIGLMDTLRNHDDLSCSRTFVLTREDMAILSLRRDMEWDFNGDGHHKLRIRYTGEPPVYPTGSISCLVRPLGDAPEESGAWSLPIPLGWTTRAAPRLTVYEDKMHLVYAESAFGSLMWSCYDGIAWTPPIRIGPMSVTDQPPALAARRGMMYCMATASGNGQVHFTFSDVGRWNGSNWGMGQISARGPALCDSNTEDDYHNHLWAAVSCFKDGHELYIHRKDAGADSGTFDDERRLVTSANPLGTPSIARSRDQLWVAVLKNNAELHTYWSPQGHDPLEAAWQTAPGPRGETRNGPVLHFDGQDLWCAHTDLDGKPYLSRRDTEMNSSFNPWSAPAPIGGQTQPTVLDTPGIITYKGRMYAFYHAQ
ncbi:hypothetical protein ACFUJY_00810 [Streptomyces sp. NPDC057249]|uniref:hypothetical protein n=1 Tax=Streptomyces sp. NPDC057249 TaxID=3346067 RepID=UPI003641F228